MMYLFGELGDSLFVESPPLAGYNPCPHFNDDGRGEGCDFLAEKVDHRTSIAWVSRRR